MSRIIAVRPVLAKAAERAVNQARVKFLECLVVTAEPFHDPRSITFDQYVIALGKILQHRLPGRVFEVEGQAFLVTISKTGRELLRVFWSGRGAGTGELI